MADLAAPAIPAVAAIPDGSAEIRRWARWWLATLILKVVAIFTALTFRVPGLLVVADVGQLIATVGLVWSLRSSLPDSAGRRASLVTGLGLVGVGVALLGDVAYQLGPAFLAIGLLAQIAIGGWLIAFGASRPRLPAPLPRRAMVGGVGYVLVGVFLYASNEPLALLVGIPGLVLVLSLIGFVFGLIDLERLEPSASA